MKPGSGFKDKKLVSWSPDYEFEVRRVNKTPEEIAKIMKKQHAEALRRIRETAQ